MIDPGCADILLFDGLILTKKPISNQNSMLGLHIICINFSQGTQLIHMLLRHARRIDAEKSWLMV